MSIRSRDAVPTVGPRRLDAVLRAGSAPAAVGTGWWRERCRRGEIDSDYCEELEAKYAAQQLEWEEDVEKAKQEEGRLQRERAEWKAGEEKRMKEFHERLRARDKEQRRILRQLEAISYMHEAKGEFREAGRLRALAYELDQCFKIKVYG